MNHKAYWTCVVIFVICMSFGVAVCCSAFRQNIKENPDLILEQCLEIAWASTNLTYLAGGMSEEQFVLAGTSYALAKSFLAAYFKDRNEETLDKFTEALEEMQNLSVDPVSISRSLPFETVDFVPIPFSPQP